MRNAIGKFLGSSLFLATLILHVNAARAQVVESDCNQNEVPDICELDPSSNPELCLLTEGPVTPAANSCGDALPLSLGFYYFGSGVGATNDGFASCGASASGPDVWYSFRNPPASEDGSADPIEVKFSMSGTRNLPGGFDPVLALFTNCPSLEGSQIACNDDNCGLDSVLQTSVADGQTIFIRISRFANGSFGDFRINVLTPESPSCIEPIGSGTDCNANGVLDQCDVTPEFGGTQIDCNSNQKPDSCDIAQFDGTQVGEETVALDRNGNGLIDACEDCNRNRVPDACDVSSVDPAGLVLWQVFGSEPGTLSCDEFCNLEGGAPAGNGEGVACGTNTDLNDNLRPDVCEPDCDGNGIPDSVDIASGAQVDCNANGRPDSCDLKSSLVGTGQYSPAFEGFVLEDNYTLQALDMFYLLFPGQNTTGRELVGPIGTSELGAKDVAVNPATGEIITVGGLGLLREGKGSEPQNLYSVNPLTGAGTALANPISDQEGVFGLTFSANGDTLFGSGFERNYVLDPVNGGAVSELPLSQGGFGLATAPNGDVYSLIPQTFFGGSSGLFEECISGVVRRLDPVTHETLDEQLVVSDFIDLCAEPGAQGGSCVVCRQLSDIAFGADGVFYGVTFAQSFDDGGPGVSFGGAGNDLVRLVDATSGPEPTPTAGGGAQAIDIGYELETVGPLFLFPTGLGGGLPPLSQDCDLNAQPDECQADCDGDGIPDACDGTTGIDQCGVCLGDGSSCACTETSLVQEQADLDGSALELKETVHLASHTLEQKSRKNRRNLRYARDVRREATALYLRAWEITWSAIPSSVTLCSGSTQCTTVSNQGAIDEYTSIMTKLRDLVADVTKRLGRLGIRRKKLNRLNNTAQQQLDVALIQIAQIPATSSDCN